MDQILLPFLKSHGKLILLADLNNGFSLQRPRLNEVKDISRRPDIVNDFIRQELKLPKARVEMLHFFDGPVPSERQRLDIVHAVELLLV
jgi:hypothetical protein